MRNVVRNQEVMPINYWARLNCEKSLETLFYHTVNSSSLVLSCWLTCYSQWVTSHKSVLLMNKSSTLFVLFVSGGVPLSCCS